MQIVDYQVLSVAKCSIAKCSITKCSTTECSMTERRECVLSCVVLDRDGVVDHRSAAAVSHCGQDGANVPF